MTQGLYQMFRETLLDSCGSGTDTKIVTQKGAHYPSSRQGKLKEAGELSLHQWMTILMEKERARSWATTVQVCHNESNWGKWMCNHEPDET